MKGVEKAEKAAEGNVSTPGNMSVKSIFFILISINFSLTKLSHGIGKYSPPACTGRIPAEFSRDYCVAIP